MSKYIVMFSEVDGRFYNVFPVAKINRDYNNPFFEPIWVDNPNLEVRDEIRMFLPGTDRNVGIIWETGEYHDVKRTIGDATWAVMDLEKACENSDWYNDHKKLHYTHFDEIFSLFREEGIYFVYGAKDTDGDCMPLYTNDHFLQMDDNGTLAGPYVEKYGTAAEGCTTWELKEPITVLQCNVKLKDGYAETNNLYRAGFVFKESLEVKKRIPIPAIGEKPDLEKLVPPTVAPATKDKEITLDYLLPADMQWGSYAETSSKLSKEFKPTRFKNEIEDSSHKNLDIEAFRYI